MHRPVGVSPMVRCGIAKSLGGDAQLFISFEFSLLMPWGAVVSQVDPSVSFDQVGGLDHYIKALKEMVFLPLVYPELFERFHLTPPRGVLFYGPPGRPHLSRLLCCHACNDITQDGCLNDLPRHPQTHGTLRVDFLRNRALSVLGSRPARCRLYPYRTAEM